MGIKRSGGAGFSARPGLSAASVPVSVFGRLWPGNRKRGVAVLGWRRGNCVLP
jgi:hypothetical protein